ncbi:RING finger protein 11-like [Argiope bruennichi]|uniref:RING finger protein 11 like protein n=1 Tax=Argiope bruennichi TaxID=94029 RepID=A0A8T0EJE4_ARGBR|nr:RING finger protein 11-like [Argiope bruennichi]KAF8773594.1 RING finger protein 11 like protein [Argiope bruennichi]
MGNCLRLCASSPEDDTLLPEHLDQDSSSSPPTPIEERPPEPVFFVSPNIGRPISQLTEDEQVKIAKRIGFIQQLPTGMYDGSNKTKECPICMGDLLFGDSIRYLPCLHIYHTSCIDDWLMRSFTCPSCVEPVDAALLSTFHAA